MFDYDPIYGQSALQIEFDNQSINYHKIESNKDVQQP